MEVAVPETFFESGNTTKIFTSNEYDGIYFLIGETDSYEEDISKNLALFLSTKYYENKITFLYEDEDGERVSGIIHNERTDEDYIFEGYYIANPKSYIFGICESKENEAYLKELIDNVYSSMVVFDK